MKDTLEYLPPKKQRQFELMAPRSGSAHGWRSFARGRREAPKHPVSADVQALTGPAK